jgi:hypothetical protein
MPLSPELMEQVIFLHAHEESEEALRQMRQSLSQRLVLVVPAQMDRLRLSLLLRLARRFIIAEARQLCVVSEDRLAQRLAIRMGFTAASSLDEYHGLKPRPGLSFRRRPSRLQTLQPRPAPDAPASSGALWPTPPPPDAPEQRPGLQGEKPRANLEEMLVDGYLQNPAALPDLEEEAEREMREEHEEHERLYYEIDDEQPSQAQQEAEQHEAEIVARILSTSHLGTSSPEPSAPDPLAEQSASNPPAARPDASQEDAPPEPPAPQPPTRQITESDEHAETRESSLPRLPTVDEMLRQHNRGEIFEWFERQAAEATTALAGSASGAGAAQSAGGALVTTTQAAEAPALVTSQAPAVAKRAERLPARIARSLTAPRSRTRARLRLPGMNPWRRIGVVSALALSLLMLGTGFLLVPYADVAYHEEISPYTEALLLDARPAGAGTRTDMQPAVQVPAEVARFDAVLTAQGDATGQRTDPNAPDHLIAFPTQDDVDQAASQLEAQMQQWGEKALRAQARDGDILGPIITDTETRAFPAVGTGLPAGVSRFQVSVALHLRAALIRRAVLLQATQDQIRREVSQVKSGFAPQPGQTPDLSILSVEPAGPGEGQLELLVQVQAHEMIGPDLTPEQVRQAIAGKDVPAAEAYLNQQPGISDVSISVQPKWLNRLPIFSARIRIDLES